MTQVSNKMPASGTMSRPPHGQRYRPGLRCSVCKNASRARIESSLALGLSCKTVAETFGVGEDALWRHRRHHMSPQHVAALLLSRKTRQVDFEELIHSESDRLLAEIVDQRVRLRSMRDMALNHGHGGIGLALVAEASIRSTLELELRLLGPLLGERLKAHDAPAGRIQRIERVIIDALASDEAAPIVADVVERAVDLPPPDLASPEPPPPSSSEPPPAQEPTPPQRPANITPLFGFSSMGRR